MLRTLCDRKEIADRKRDHSLIVGSGMSFTECEDWFGLYTIVEESGADNGVTLNDVRELFSKIGLTWGLEENARLIQWLHEHDENQNGKIEFGEFFCLMSTMWNSNFANIMSKAVQGPKRKR